MTTYKPHKDDSSWNYDLDFLDNFNGWKIFQIVNHSKSSGTNITEVTIATQEYQDYYDQQDQQYIAHK